jgi:MFS family permease
VVALGPFAGVVCDRWGRIRTLIASNVAAAVILASMLALFTSGNLSEPWLYAALVTLGAALAFQYPALLASVTALVPRRHHARASGLLSLTISVAGVLGPATATVVLSHTGLGMIFTADLVSYLVCALTLSAAKSRERQVESADTPARARLLSDLRHGFRYIAARPGLLALQTLFFLSYFAAMFGVLLPPMILASSNGAANGAAVLAVVLGAAGAGGIAGGLMTAIWGPRHRHVLVILIGFVLTGLLAQLPLGLSGSPVVWAVASFFGAFLYPPIEAASQAIWLSQTPVAEQGRIFAARRVMTESAGLAVLLLAGPLADDVFEPGMREGGWLRPVFGWLVGTGAGSSMAAIFVLSGTLTLTIGGLGFTVRRLRDLDRATPVCVEP